MADLNERARQDGPDGGPTGVDDTPGLTVSRERLVFGTERQEAGRVRVRKHVDVQSVSESVPRGVEEAETERVAVNAAERDSGEVEVLPDGSLSIPVFEEELVVTKRLVVRERVVVRKHTVYEDETVSADLRRERLEVEADGDVVVRDDDRQG